MVAPNADEGERTRLSGRFTRRRFILGLAGGLVGSVVSVPPTHASPSAVSVQFDDCHTAVITGARDVETLSVYYARQQGTRLARYEIPVTETELYAYRPLLVRHNPAHDRTTVRLAARGSLVRVVIDHAAGDRTGHANAEPGCVSAGFNSPPTATVTATTAARSVHDGETLVAAPGEEVTLVSTATDPDLPTDRLREAWDLDGDGVCETRGWRVTTTYAEAGPVTVSHRVADDFGMLSVATVTVDVRRPWRLRRKVSPPSLGTGDQFGTAVHLTADTLVATGPGDDDRGANAGAAYVYDAGDLSRPATKLTPAFLQRGDLAGIAVAASGESLLVSAVCDDEQGADAGVVYVYDFVDLSRPPTRLAPPTLRAHDFLGLSMAALDDTLVAGAHLDDERGSFAGSVFVFDLADPTTARKLAPAGLAERDLFGISVAVTDEWLVSGAVGDDDSGPQAGAVYVYDRADLDAPPARLTPDDLAAGDQFGRPLAAAGDTLVVGTPFDDDGGPQAGAVYVYDLTELARPPTKLVPEGLVPGDLFGYSVALSAETLAVGAIGDDDGGTDTGAVYVYDRADLARPPTKVAPDSLAPGDLFGFSVAVAEGTLAVGAVFDDERGDDAGAVYVFQQ